MKELLEDFKTSQVLDEEEKHKDIMIINKRVSERKGRNKNSRPFKTHIGRLSKSCKLINEMYAIHMYVIARGCKL